MLEFIANLTAIAASVVAIWVSLRSSRPKTKDDDDVT